MIMKKIYLIVFAIFSLFMIVYGFIFILDYHLVINYTIEDCLPPNGGRAFPTRDERTEEIHALIIYAKIVIAYAIYALSLAIYRLFNTNKRD